MIKLGIIGYNEGNGHPYSYSSIFNGFDMDYMKDCPYPSIPKYLNKHNSDEERLKSAKVSHIWTQDKDLSCHIAKSSKIENVCEDLEEMISEVDGVIIARDDYETHYDLSKLFIDAGLNVFIDKPIENSVIKAQKILSLERFNGQIYSISSLANDPRVIDAKQNIKSFGKVKYIYGTAPGKWDRYAIHLIDVLLMILGKDLNFIEKDTNVENRVTTRTGRLINNAFIELKCMGGIPSPLRITIICEKGFYDIDFYDPFNAFKNTLSTFVKSIIEKSNIRPHKEILDSISLIELD